MKMKNKGFTLIELMGVIIIIALVTLIATPNIVNQINTTSNEVSKTQLAIIEAAADNYLSNHTSQYPATAGRVYCLTLQELIEDNMLIDPIVDVQTQEIISNDRVLQATVKNTTYEYKLLDAKETCTAK